MNILNAQQIRELDQFTIENEPISSIDLMERASIRVMEVIDSTVEDYAAVIFCGSGNNGGGRLSYCSLNGGRR